MTNLLLYVLTVLIWGSTWIGIHYQLGHVAPEWSTSYRMILAAAIMNLFCLATKRRMRFPKAAHIRFALTGLLMFSLNYLLMYLATGYIASGLVAITFCFITVMNIINGAIFFKTRLHPRVLMGALVGLVGITCVFWPEFSKLNLSGHPFIGFALALISTAMASFGNMVSVSLQKAKIPVLQSNAWGLIYGSVFITLTAFVGGHPATFALTAPYVVSLVFLAVFGTVVAFYTYLTLLGNIGADRAAYSSVLYPIIALTLSTFIEGYHWTVPAIVGVVLVLMGNVIVLSRRKTAASI